MDPQCCKSTTRDFELLAEIVKIKTLRLAVFIERNYQIRNRLSLGSPGLCIACLFALRLPLGFLDPFFLTGPFFHPFGKSCSRASCHRYSE